MSAAKAAVQACRVGISPFGHRQSLSLSVHTSTPSHSLPQSKRSQFPRQNFASASSETHQRICASSGYHILEAAGLGKGLIIKQEAEGFNQWWITRGGKERQGRNVGRRRPACVGASAEGHQMNEVKRQDCPLVFEHTFTIS